MRTSTVIKVGSGTSRLVGVAYEYDKTQFPGNPAVVNIVVGDFVYAAPTLGEAMKLMLSHQRRANIKP